LSDSTLLADKWSDSREFAYIKSGGLAGSINFFCLAVRKAGYVMDQTGHFAFVILNERQFRAVDPNEKISFGFRKNVWEYLRPASLSRCECRVGADWKGLHPRRNKRRLQRQEGAGTSPQNAGAWLFWSLEALRSLFCSFDRVCFHSFIDTEEDFSFWKENKTLASVLKVN
jgi:hypothetical protein